MAGLYTLLYAIALLVVGPFEYLKRPRGSRRRWLLEKLGNIPNRCDSSACRIWIHAVSVGEVLSAVPLVKALRDRIPSACIILSTITDTGQTIARERLSDAAQVVYLPFDLPFALARAVASFRPAMLVVVETEIWPNLFRVFKTSGAVLAIVNGRLSDRSFSGYRKIRFFLRSVLSQVDAFCMQSSVYADRIAELGAEPARIRATGNFKFDMQPPAGPPQWASLVKGRIIVAGSTHDDEEALIVDSFSELRRDFPDLTLILAPRHPHRFAEVEALVGAKGLVCTRRSALDKGAGEPSSGRVILLDTVGELAAVYGVGEIAIMGGSFIPHGGHNPLEPAFWGKPVVCGPHMENFPFAGEMFARGAAIQTDRAGLSAAVRTLLLSPEAGLSTGCEAKKICQENAGAVARTVDILEAHLKGQLPVAKEKALP